MQTHESALNPAALPAEPPVATALDETSRQDLVAQLAYFRAETRNFEPGHEIEDWLLAEAEVNARLSGAGFQAEH
jgi:hypothetical protein